MAPAPSHSYHRQRLGLLPTHHQCLYPPTCPPFRPYWIQLTFLVFLDPGTCAGSAAPAPPPPPPPPPPAPNAVSAEATRPRYGDG